jgi:magnesium-transporting ATPase (P-type)
MLDKTLDKLIKLLSILIGTFSTISFIIEAKRNFSIQLVGLYLFSIIIAILIYRSSNITNP